MEYPALASPIHIERLLELACAYNAPLSIQLESGEDIYRYKSRMLDLTKGGGSKTLVIDMPSSQGPAKALTPGAQITLFFALEPSRYAFDSVVLGKTSFALSGDKKISALEISYPDVLKSGQRRAYFRVPIPMRNPIKVDCDVIGDGAKQQLEEESPEEALSRPILQGDAINLSVGGMLIEFEKSELSLIEVGAKLDLVFSLDRGEEPLKFSAIIRRVEEKAASGKPRAGVEFVDTDKEFKCRLAINRLYKYVAERQREMIQTGTE
jgi:c-di-GMP-binding flagellar brake protein YcgR